MIYFLRHGLDDETRIGGWSNLSLLDEGVAQVKESANKIKEMNLPIVKIITSDIKRAEETASIVSNIIGVDNLEVNSNLREQNKGDLNGMPKEEADIKFPEFKNGVEIDTVYPNGESMMDMYNRTKKLLDYFDSLEDNTLIVTHRGIINMIYFLSENRIPDMNKKQFKVTHASLHEYDKNNRTIRKVF